MYPCVLLSSFILYIPLSLTYQPFPLVIFQWVYDFGLFLTCLLPHPHLDLFVNRRPTRDFWLQPCQAFLYLCLIKLFLLKSDTVLTVLTIYNHLCPERGLAGGHTNISFKLMCRKFLSVWKFESKEPMCVCVCYKCHLKCVTKSKEL